MTRQHLVPRQRLGERQGRGQRQRQEDNTWRQAQTE
jgi:hypothetical protein